MPRYRARRGYLTTQWRSTYREAEEAAVKRRWGRKDEVLNAPGQIASISLDDGVSIESYE